MTTANAEPFSVVVRAEFSREDDDPYDLDGATIEIVYSADTTHTATSSGIDDNNAAVSFFDVFTMSVDITNRPNGAPDITGLTTRNDPIAHNYFPPATRNDELSFDHRDFDTSLGLLEIETLRIDFGSQTFFPGNTPIEDLSFLEPLINSTLSAEFTGPIAVERLDMYDLVGTTVLVRGIESVLEVDFDIMPQTCPNPLNVRSSGVLPVAILGTTDFDVNEIDISSITLEGVSPIRWNIEDVSTSVDGEPCDCTEAGADGFDDLTLKFDRQAIIAALRPVNGGDDIPLTLTGKLLDGTDIVGFDCIVVTSPQ